MHHDTESPFHRHGRRFMRGRRHGPGSGHGLAYFGGGFGGEEMGGRGFPAGRKLGAGGLQLLILALLKEKPRYGYEIIKALEEHSGGYYAPSPGMVYPALTYLEELGRATVKDDGAKRLYRITADGETELDKNREEADAMLERLARIGQKMERVREAFAGGEAGEDEESAPELKAARRALKGALREKHGAPRAEQKRLAEILERATREIRG
ncbi:MAG: helix-turn-helix transcriptional regulator [Stellaceae bacterium]|jgi:DNA-binding PadR family transcriptional regulator